MKQININFRKMSFFNTGSDRRAFTLIELLVVVLIIGILAAVALPQYQKAVDRTRITQLLTFATATKNAQEAFYLENNYYTTDWTSLSVSLSCNSNGAICNNNTAGWHLTLNAFQAGNIPASVTVTDTHLPDISLTAGYTHSGFKSWNNKTACDAKKTNARANALCKLISGNTTGEENGGNYRYKF